MQWNTKDAAASPILTFSRLLGLVGRFPKGEKKERRGGVLHTMRNIKAEWPY